MRNVVDISGTGQHSQAGGEKGPMITLMFLIIRIVLALLLLPLRLVLLVLRGIGRLLVRPFRRRDPPQNDS